MVSIGPMGSAAKLYLTVRHQGEVPGNGRYTRSQLKNKTKPEIKKKNSSGQTVLFWARFWLILRP